jgi:hypothetical protein
MIKVNDTVACESRLISKKGCMLQIVGLQNTLQEATGKPPSLHNGQEE